MSNRRCLLGFFLCAYAFTWALWLPLAAASAGGPEWRLPEQPLRVIGSFGPFAAALLWTAVEQGGPGVRKLLRGLFAAGGSPRWVAVALLLPAASWLGALALWSLAQGQSASPRPALELSSIPVVFVIILFAGGPLGEEPGWRGFALPRLQVTRSRLAASGILAAAWAGWHLPLWFMGDRSPGYPFWLFLLGTVPLTVLFTWLYDRSGGSVLVAVLFHAAVNTSLTAFPADSAFPTWVVLLWALAPAVVAGDRRRFFAAWAPTGGGSRPPPC